MAENGGSRLEWMETWRRWQELQAEAFRLWLEAWGNTLSGAFPGWRTPSGGEGEREAGAGGAVSLFQEWMEYNRDLMSRFGIPVTGVGPETFLRTFHSAEIYGELYSLWMEMAEDYRRAVGEKGEFDLEALHALLDRWAEKYRELVDKVFTPALPEPLQWVAELYSGEIPLLAGGLTAQFWAPWAEFARSMSRRGFSLERPTPETALKVYEEWRKAYEESYGRLLRMPAMGYYRESMEKYAKTMDSLNEFGIALAEFYAALQGAGIKGFERLRERMASMREEGGDGLMSFRDFYRLWWQTNEDIYVDLFRTEEFSRLLGQLVDKGMEFRSAFQAYVEEISKELPFPNRSEMDHLYRTLDRLKREVRSLKKELREMRGAPTGSGGEG
ncbi:MAG: poly(R)-hydroxyalkanoic acid synthase subunit PhaE [Actinomycetota bacterium]|nr:poly(R)-hydroxyalkanoic acid synthase subunit PhaE [Actinomycetota bacterium]MDI7253319.1 poly(R)-hydroxyalkanoic acid synthase subunit PhaE [Actinomycetota bacterium]